MSQILWSVKYAPRKIQDTFASPMVIKKLTKMKEGIIPHIIFTGPPSCGKFTIAKIFAEQRLVDPSESLRLVSTEVPITTEEKKGLNRISYVSKKKIGSSAGSTFIWPHFLHARIIDFVFSAPLRFPFKILIIREFHKIAEQESFRRIMEQYSYCRFLLTSSNPSAIIEPIKSRCILINVSKPILDKFIKRIQIIEENEHVSIPLDVIKYLYSFFKGNAGSAINTIQLLHTKGNEVNIDNLKKMLEGQKHASVIPLLNSAFDKSLPLVKQKLDKMIELMEVQEIYEMINEEISQMPLQSDEDKESVCDSLQYMAGEELKLIRGYNKRIQLINILMNLY